MSQTETAQSFPTEKRHFLPPDGGESPPLDVHDNGGNDGMDFSLWDSKPQNHSPQSVMAFENQTYNGPDFPNIEMTQCSDGDSKPNGDTALTKQDQAVDEMIDILKSQKS